MSYNEQAIKMNERLILFFNKPVSDISEHDKNGLIDTILWFGQVAKFRCRSNAAYDSFVKIVFKGIANIQRVPDETNPEWEKLQVIEEP